MQPIGLETGSDLVEIIAMGAEHLGNRDGDSYIVNLNEQLPQDSHRRVPVEDDRSDQNRFERRRDHLWTARSLRDGLHPPGHEIGVFEVPSRGRLLNTAGVGVKRWDKQNRPFATEPGEQDGGNRIEYAQHVDRIEPIEIGQRRQDLLLRIHRGTTLLRATA